MARLALIASVVASVATSVAPIVVAGCTTEPRSYSASVSIHLKLKSGDTESSVVTNEKGITTESGNPFGAFVAEAQRTLGGHDPAVIDVDKVELRLGADSSGVTTLGDVFDGDVDVLFQMNDTGNTYPVATRALDASTSAGPIALDLEFPADDVDEDLARMLTGSFKVVVRGDAAAGWTTKGADADVQTTFLFAAFE